MAVEKAVKISSRLPGVTVLGADSTLALDDGTMLAKPESPDEAADHLRRMAGTRHRLFSAVVAAQDGKPVWRAIGEATLWNRPLSDGFETGRASGRERECQYVEIAVGVVSFKKTKNTNTIA